MHASQVRRVGCQQYRVMVQGRTKWNKKNVGVGIVVFDEYMTKEFLPVQSGSRVKWYSWRGDKGLWFNDIYEQWTNMAGILYYALLTDRMRRKTPYVAPAAEDDPMEGTQEDVDMLVSLVH